MAFTFTKSSPSTGSVAIYELKERLKSAGWTVLSSSDGTTYNSGGDQITGGGSGANGMANTNAWFRIRDPGGVASFIFQRGTTNVLWRIKYSRSAGFTGGSPSATQTPSATDENTFWGGGTDASPTFGTLFSTDGTYRWNVGADNAAPYGWWAGSFPIGGGNPLTALVYEPVTGAEATDSSKYVFYIASSTAGASPFLYAAGGLSTEAFASNTHAIYGYVPSAGTGAFTTFPALALYVANGGTVVAPTGLGTNPITTKDESFPIVFARRAAFPPSAYKGVSTLMKWCGTTRATGDTLTVSTSRDRIVYRDVSLPWDGTVPTV